MIRHYDHNTILANLSRHRPVDLDRVLFDTPELAEPCSLEPHLFPPSSELWSFPDDAPSYIGIRIKKPIDHPEFLAARLASIAIERQVHPVFLSYIGNSVMQQFGFRVEQLMGLNEQNQKMFETQLERLWQFVLIIDVSDIDDLG